jgi:hypothetical protein
MTHIELYKLALDALEMVRVGANTRVRMDFAIAALQAALAEPSEPVAWITKGGKGDLWWYQSCTEDGELNPEDLPLYTHPPVPVRPTDSEPLTEGEIDSIADTCKFDGSSTAVYPHEFARAIEAAIRSKT